jgi:hypothetical protein
MSRHCARPGCGEPAAATLAYDYATQLATLGRLSPEPHPMTHDLCDDHAARTSVPRGWFLEDRRAVAVVVAEFPTPLAS